MEDGEQRSRNGPTDNPKIIIVGAGISGIACGNLLSREGFSNFKIFEASDRIGGRIWSISMGKCYVL
jgi:spermine oxidase